MQLTNDGNIYFPDENGHWVSDNQRRIGRILQDYDPTLQLQWIPPNERSTADLAFRVVSFPGNGSPPYAVCFSEECDERLLARVFQADNSRSGSAISYLDAHNAAVEAIRLKQQMESTSEANEMAYSILHSNKVHYKHNGFDFGRVGGRF